MWTLRRFRRVVFRLATVLLILSGGLYVLAPHPPATPRRVDGTGELDLYLDRLVQSGSPPSLSVVVVKDGRIVYDRAVGRANEPRGEAATPQTVYHWWSITKIPTAVAVMQLYEQGKLSLNDPVTRYLPWFVVRGPATGTKVITVRNLMQHTSGLPDTIPSMIRWAHYDNATRDQTRLVKRHLSEFNKLEFAPGSKASYSNFNYMVLGAVIESVSHERYEAYVDERVLEPLGMSRTGFVYSKEMAVHEAAGTLPVVHYYTPLLPALLDMRTLIREWKGRLLWMNRVYIDATPSSGLIGPAGDMADLMIAYLNHGELRGRRILRPESVRMLSETPPIDGHGLGWFIGHNHGLRFLEHAGGGPGFATEMRLYPDAGLGIALLSNGTELDRNGLTSLLAGLNLP